LQSKLNLKLGLVLGISPWAKHHFTARTMIMVVVEMSNVCRHHVLRFRL